MSYLKWIHEWILSDVGFFMCVADSSSELDNTDESDIEEVATSALFTVSGFQPSVQFPCSVLCTYLWILHLLNIFKHLFFRLCGRRSACPQNVEVGAVWQVARKPTGAWGDYLQTPLSPPVHSQLLQTTWSKMLQRYLKIVKLNRFNNLWNFSKPFMLL